MEEAFEEAKGAGPGSAALTVLLEEYCGCAGATGDPSRVCRQTVLSGVQTLPLSTPPFAV